MPVDLQRVESTLHYRLLQSTQIRGDIGRGVKILILIIVEGQIKDARVPSLRELLEEAIRRIRFK